MKRVCKYLFVFLGSLFMFPLVSNAECSYERQAELSKIASNVSFNYSYNVVNQIPEFTVEIENITKDITVINREFDTFAVNGTNRFNHSVSGATLTYNIYSNDPNCSNQLITTKYITIPYYNYFSNIEACLDYPNFPYCQKWMNTEGITQEHFDKELEKDRNAVADDFEDKQFQKNILEEFFIQNKAWIIMATVSTFLAVLLILTKRRMKKWQK